MSNPFVPEVIKSETPQSINDKKIVEINSKQLEDNMKNHICHRTINYVPQFIKEQFNWMYSNHNSCPSDSNGIKKSYKDSRNIIDFNTMVSNNTNKMYYTLILDGSVICVDIDKCFDENNQILDFAKDIVNELREFNPYIEKSKSGKGLHVFFKGSKSWLNKNNIQIKMKDVHDKYKDLKSGIDFLIKNHCIILTGDIWENNNPQKIGTINNKVKELYKRLESMKSNDRGNIKTNYQKKLKNKSTDEQTVFDLINSQVSIEDVANRYPGVDGYSKSLINCPFPKHNDSTPSFMFYGYSNSFNCFGCNKGGDVVQFVAEMEQIMNLDSAKLISKWYNLDINFDKVDNKLEENWIIIDGEGKVEVDLSALAEHMSEEHQIKVTEFDLYNYDSGIYRRLEARKLEKLIEEHMPSIYNNKYKDTKFVREVKNRLERNFINFNEFNRDKYILNLKDTSLRFELNTDTIEDIGHDSNRLTTYQVQGRYDKDYKKNKDVLWHEFLDYALPKGQQKLLQEIFGYLLIDNNDAKKFFSLLGAGDTGKSVILKLLNKMVGDEYTSAIELQELANPNNKFATYSLYGKFLNVCGDLSSKVIQDTSMIKMLTGGDKIRYEQKNNTAIYDYNHCRIINSLNRLPSSYDKCRAFFDRMIIIQFENVVKKEDQIKDLENKFNINYVINWAIEGLQRLMKHNLEFSLQEKNEELVSDYVETDVPLVEFINEYCTVTGNKEDYIYNKDFLDCYKNFASNILFDEKLSKSIKLKNLVSDIKTRYSKIKNSKNLANPETGTKTGRGFTGIKLRLDKIKELNPGQVF